MGFSSCWRGVLQWPVPAVIASVLMSIITLGGCPAPPPPVPPASAGAAAKAGPAGRPRHAYRELSAEGWKTSEIEGDMDLAVPPFDVRLGAGRADQLKAAFRGKDRSRSKTSIVDGVEIETFGSVAALQAALPADDTMLDHDPEITRQTMDRAPEEQRMVHVDAWIYAIKYESDNDWHLITGTNPDGSHIRYFNAEVSGLPKKQSPAFAALRDVRESLSSILDDDPPGPGKYRKYDPPIAVAIEGALFFDVDHAAGAVGPGDMKPTTAWEIHPITRLVER